MGKSKKRQKYTNLDASKMDSILQEDSAKEKQRKRNNSDDNHVTSQPDSVLNQDNLQKNPNKEIQIDIKKSELNSEDTSIITSKIKNDHTKNNLQKGSGKEKERKCTLSELASQFHNLSTIDDLQENPDKEVQIDNNRSKFNAEQTSATTSTINNDLIDNNPQENSRKKKKKSKSKRTNKEKTISNSSNTSKNNGLEYEELDEDLFKLGNEYAYAHCVAEDLRMGAGIAVEFKRIFGNLGKLFDQNLRVGDVGVLNHKNQYIFYLVTKKYSNGKPTLDSLKKTLVKLHDEMIKNNLTKLAIPKLGCGLDGLDWLEVQNCIKNIFHGSGIHITVCIPSLSKITDKKISKALNIYTTPKNVWEMESGTDFILFLDRRDLKQCKLDEIAKKIDARYPFVNELLRDMNSQKSEHVYEYNKVKERILCIIEPSKNYYESIEQIFRNDMRKIKKPHDVKYYALQFENSEKTKRIIEIIRSVFRCGVSELYLCGIEDHPEYTYYDDYCRSLRQKNVFYNSTHMNKKISDDHVSLKV